MNILLRYLSFVDEYLLLFLIINFCVGFFSDIVLNFLSRQEFMLSGVKALKPYFMKHSVLSAALYAGITVVVTLVFMMLVMFTLQIEYSNFNLISFSFVAGFIADILIEKLKIFGNDLDEYYSNVGGGVWGGLAIMFSVINTVVVMHFFQLRTRKKNQQGEKLATHKTTQKQKEFDYK